MPTLRNWMNWAIRNTWDIIGITTPIISRNNAISRTRGGDPKSPPRVAFFPGPALFQKGLSGFIHFAEEQVARLIEHNG